MWKLLEQAAKTATANASEYVSTVQTKAQSLVATVQDEAATLLHAIGSARTGPVDELLYEEIDDYKVFCETFKIDVHTDEISQILQEDDEIRGLHEQMVPEQLSYEEFWSRYFFRREQEQLREQREAERKKQQREQEEAKAAAKAVLEEFEVEDEDDEEFAAPRSKQAEDEGVGDDDQELVPKDPADTEEGEATLEQLRELRASRKAAQQWKQKALEYQAQLNALAEKHEEEKQQLKATMESQYQSLCDTYEAKMMEVTTQIDDARAVGYNEGIQESEAIVATMRQEADEEMNRLKAQLAAEGQGAEKDGTTAELNRLKEALSLKEQVISTLEQQKSDLEMVLREKDAASEQALAASSDAKYNDVVLEEENTTLKQELETLRGQVATLQTQLAASATEGGLTEEAKKEIEIWKVRAIKMKKMKEQLEAEVQQLKESSQQVPASAIPSEEVAALHAQISTLQQEKDVLTAQISEAFAKGSREAEARSHAHIAIIQAELEAAKQQASAVAEEAFSRGAASAQAHMDAQLTQLREEVAKVSEAARAETAAQYQHEIDSLRSELAALREVQAKTATVSPSPPISAVSGDVLAQADAMLSSLGSPTSVTLPGGDLLDDSWTLESDNTTTSTQPDWGEW